MITNSHKKVGFLSEEDFIPAGQYRALGIPAEFIPPEFKVWKHSYPPLDNFLNSQGGNAYGISMMEMATRGVDRESMELLSSDDYRKINRFYRTRGIFKVISKDRKEYYLVPESVEAVIRFEVADKVRRISEIIRGLSESLGHRRLLVGTLSAKGKLLYNRLKNQNQGVVFQQIQMEKKEEFGRFDLIYLASDPNELLSSVNLCPDRSPPLPHKWLFSFIPLRIYDLLAPDGRLFLLGPNQISNPQIRIGLKLDKQSVWFKSFFFYLNLFQLEYRLDDSDIRVTQTDILNFCNFPQSGLAEAKLTLQLNKDWADTSFDEIKLACKKGIKRKELFRYSDNHYLSSLFFEEEESSYLPAYFSDCYRVSLPFDPFKQIIYKKRKLMNCRQIVEELSREHFISTSLDLVAGYKDTFDYLLKVLKIVKEILGFDLDKSEPTMKSVSDFPFMIEDGHSPVEPMMKLKNLISNKNNYFYPLFQLANKYKQIELMSKVFQLYDSRVSLLDNLGKFSLFGFSKEEIREIILIISGHGPMTRIVYGKYPLKTLAVLTNKIHEKGQTYIKMKYMLENFTFCSIAEALANRGRTFNESQWKHFFQLLRDAKEVVGDTSRELDWELIQKKEIDAFEGAINMTCMTLMRMMGYFFPMETISALKEKSEEELLMEADYRPEKAEQLKEIKELLLLMERFKVRNYSQNDFSKPYMFRNVLECEFHGTGRIFFKLGLIRAFKLLWISTVPSITYKIDFNYLPRSETDLGKLSADLDRLDEGKLTLEYLDEVKEELKKGKVAYIYDTGIQLTWDDPTSSLRVGYVNLNKSVSRLNCLMKSVEGLRVSGISPPVLHEIEKLFFNIEKYPYVFNREINRLKKSGEPSPRIIALKKKLTMVNNLKNRVRERFLQELFNPGEVYTDLFLLYRNCRYLLNFLLKEFAGYAQIKPRRIEQSRTVSDYILRCVEKLQALATGDRESFSNVLFFKELSLREFGDVPEALPGVYPRQFIYLRKIYSGLPEHLKLAMPIALIFQDIGKIPEYKKKYGNDVDWTDHAYAGAKVLEIKGTLAKLSQEKTVSGAVIKLIRYHGVFGQALRGEFSQECFQEILPDCPPPMLDAFFLVSVISASAIKEDFLTYDRLLDFIRLHSLLRRNIKSRRYWDYRRSLKNKAGSLGLDPSQEEEGHRAIALERVFKLAGVAYVYYYEALQKYRNPRLSGLFFYQRKRDIKSIGPGTYLSQLDRAVLILKEFNSIPHETAGFLEDSLYRQSGNYRFFSAESGLSKLEVGFLWRLLLLSLSGGRMLTLEKRPKIDFMELADLIDSRVKLVQRELNGYDYEQLADPDFPRTFLEAGKRGITLRLESKFNVMKVGFSDYVDEEKLIGYLEGITNLDTLERAYSRIRVTYKASRFMFDDQMDRIALGYSGRLAEVKMLAVERVQVRMWEIVNDVVNFPRSFSRLKRIFERACRAKFFDDRLIHLLTDKYEYCLGELRNQFIRRVIEKIENSGDLPELENQYLEIKNFFKTHQSFFRKELQQYVLSQYVKKKKRLMAEKGYRI